MAALKNSIPIIPGLGFNFLTKLYDFAIYTLMPSNFSDTLIHSAEPQDNDIILDFGTGTGENLLALNNLNPKAVLIGIDADYEIIKIALKKIAPLKKDITILQSTNSTLPFSNNYFDKVFSCLVFSSLSAYQKKEKLVELYRVLKYNGSICIGDWGREKSYLKRLFVKGFHKITPYRQLTINSNKSTIEYLRETGFRNISITGKIKTITGTFYSYHAHK